MPIEIPKAADAADPVEAALVAWMRCADLYRDGRPTRTGLRLLGGNVAAERAYAAAIAAHLRERGSGLDALIECLLDHTRAGKIVRAYSIADEIAEGALVMLQGKGLA